MNIRRTLYRVANASVVALALSLIGYDLYRHYFPPETETAIEGKFLKYTSFEYERFGEFDVITGTAYDNATDLNIIRQWCYLVRRNHPKNDLRSSINLYRDGIGEYLKPRQYTERALSYFGLTNDQVLSLRTTHCKITME